MTRILAFAGSARRTSLNRRLLAVAVREARALGAEVTLVELSDHSMPIYDGDLEEREGIPEGAVRLRELLLSHDALLVASPEYNGSLTPLLKNTIDWTSRPDGDLASSAAYQGKVAALVSASPGRLGGLRALSHLRTVLSGIGVMVIPGDVSIGVAHRAFADDGGLADQGNRERLAGALRRLVTTAEALRSVADRAGGRGQSGS